MNNDIRNQQIVKDLEKLVSFMPVTTDKQKSHMLLEFVKKRLDKLGLKTKLVEHNGYSSLVAGTMSLSQSKVLLQGHIDVVPAEPKLFSVKHVGDKLFGRGVYDMLFGTTSFLSALESLDNLSELDIGIMLTSDEEIGGFDGVGRLARNYSCDVCFLPDAGGKDLISIEAKGVLELKITVQGKAGHAARPLEYDNPIEKLAEIIIELKNTFPNINKDATTCSQTRVKAGEATNQVPDIATMYLDIRYVAQDDPMTLAKTVQQISTKHGAFSEIVICEPSFSVSPENEHVKRFVRIHEASSKRKLQTMKAPGNSDARFLTAKGIPVIMTRPLGGGLHAPDEWISISSLVEFTHTLTEFLKVAAS